MEEEVYMATDMKYTIAEAARRLLLEKNVTKLTVKDIVEECQITRQTFYYHFEDIPDMFRWMLEQGTKQLAQEIEEQESTEAGLRYFFLVAVHVNPFIRKGLQTNYRDDIEKLMEQLVYQLVELAAEKHNLAQSCTLFDYKLTLRYHSQAMMGILRGWTDEDTEQMDEMVHSLYLMLQKTFL